MMEHTRVFVKNLPHTLTETEFRKHFSAKGRDVTDIKFYPRRRIGFVGYSSAKDAAEAVRYFDQTFVRMSKVTVQLAKPFNDASVSGANGSKHGAKTAHDTPKPIEPSQVQDTHENPKKRKREALNEADPKLQDYLQTMQPGYKITKSGNGDPGKEVINSESKQPAAEPAADSDDEYEAVPKIPSQNLQPEEKAETRVDKIPKGDEPHPLEVQNVQNGNMTSRDTQMFNSVDDEWLRNRTSRLLDLVDPDDEGSMKKAQETPSAEQAAHQNVTEEMTDIVLGDQAEPAPAGESIDDKLDLIRRTSRLFLRNLPYSATEDAIASFFEPYGTLEEVHLPVGRSGSKGIAFVDFSNADAAIAAFEIADGKPFQGRILHIIPAAAKKETKLDDFALSKLPLKKQNLIKKRAEASNGFNWNSLYMNVDAVNTSTAARLGVSKSDLLDPTSTDAAVKQAIAETSIIQEAKAYFTANGVDLDTFNSKSKRGDKAILVKNFPYGTSMEVLRKLFERYGTVLRVLMPPSGTICIVQFAQAAHAKAAFSRLAYSRMGDSIIYLEKAPKDLLESQQPDVTLPKDDHKHGIQKLSAAELLERDEQIETSSLFVRGLNFETTSTQLAEAFGSLDGFVSARIKTKPDAKHPGQVLSLGFGFVAFRSAPQAKVAINAMDGHVLDGYTLNVRGSHRGHDEAEERRRNDQAKKAAAKTTKIIIKNLPFEISKKELRALLGNYGQLRACRIPKKFGSSSRGYGFVEFATARDAQSALEALNHTHLLGRRLVLEPAESDTVDPEEEIARLERKVARQTDAMTLQQLTGRGRKKFNIGDEEGEA